MERERGKEKGREGEGGMGIKFRAAAVFVDVNRPSERVPR